MGGGPPSNGGGDPYVDALGRRSVDDWDGSRWADPWGPPVYGYDDRYAHGTHEMIVILINYTDSTSGSPQLHDPLTHDPQFFDEEGDLIHARIVRVGKNGEELATLGSYASKVEIRDHH